MTQTKPQTKSQAKNFDRKTFFYIYSGGFGLILLWMYACEPPQPLINVVQPLWLAAGNGFAGAMARNIGKDRAAQRRSELIESSVLALMALLVAYLAYVDGWGFAQYALALIAIYGLGGVLAQIWRAI